MQDIMVAAPNPTISDSEALLSCLYSRESSRLTEQYNRPPYPHRVSAFHGITPCSCTGNSPDDEEDPARVDMTRQSRDPVDCQLIRQQGIDRSRPTHRTPLRKCELLSPTLQRVPGSGRRPCRAGQTDQNELRPYKKISHHDNPIPRPRTKPRCYPAGKQ